MNGTIQIELTEKEWGVILVVMAEFSQMFTNFVINKPLEISLLREGLADPEFSNDMMSAGDQLRIVANKTEGKEPPTVAVHQRHGSLISVGLEKLDFVVLWTCWQAMIKLLGQAMQNKELRMPVESLPPAKFYERFGRDIESMVKKLPK